VRVFTGARVEHAAGGKLAVLHQCRRAVSEIAPKGKTKDGRDLY
jgi:hypothetical protein